jgi:hypothetical protein
MDDRGNEVTFSYVKKDYLLFNVFFGSVAHQPPT